MHPDWSDAPPGFRATSVLDKADVERGAHADDDLLLAGREVGDLLVEAIGPELRAGLRRAELEPLNGRIAPVTAG